MPELSVLLPFYNPGNDLYEAVNSVLAQRFTDFELLLIDNNSDKTNFKIAESCGKKDKRIRIISCPEQGIAYALNEGLKNACGQFIARMDHDDIALPDRFEKQYECIKQNQNIDLVSCQADFHSTLTNAEGYHYFVNWQNKIISPEEHFIYRFIESPLAHPTIFCYKKIFDKEGSYNTGNIPEDYELWLRWLEKGIRFYKIPEKLIIWRDHKGRLSRNHCNYSEEAFLRVKFFYLARWLKKRHIHKVIICGASKKVQWRASLLEEQGIVVQALIDIKQRKVSKWPFFIADKMNYTKDNFYVSMIAQRKTGEKITSFLKDKGLKEGVNFIRAA